MKKSPAPRSFLDLRSLSEGGSEVGFTLIETIVVVSVISLTLPVLFAIIIILMKQQVKVYRLSQIKREGDYVISVIENTIRSNAVSIHSATPPTDINVICRNIGVSTPEDSIYFLDKNNNWFGYSATATGNSVVSSSAITPSIPLTSSKVLITVFSTFCTKNSVYSPASILLSFDVCYDTGSGICSPTRPEEYTSMHYQIRIKLRNY